MNHCKESQENRAQGAGSLKACSTHRPFHWSCI